MSENVSFRLNLKDCGGNGQCVCHMGYSLKKRGQQNKGTVTLK